MSQHVRMHRYHHTGALAALASYALFHLVTVFPLSWITLTSQRSLAGFLQVQMVGVTLMGVDQGTFWSQMQNAVDLRDVNEGIVKSLAFGLLCSLLAVYEGYNTVPTAEGVGLATTRTVVASSVMTLVVDYMLTAAFIKL